MELPSPAAEVRILAAISHGVHGHVAAGIAGVPRPVFLSWMRHGRRARAGRLRDFYCRIDQALAEARARAEMQVMEKDVRYWLRYGPGKDDWNTRRPERDQDQSLLANIEFNRLVSGMSRKLEAFPDAQRVLREPRKHRDLKRKP